MELHNNFFIRLNPADADKLLSLLEKVHSDSETVVELRELTDQAWSNFLHSGSKYKNATPAEPSIVISNFPVRLKQALEVRNMKQITLSEKSGVSRSLISAYLKGDYEAKRTKLSALAVALEVSEEWLAGLDVPMSK